MYSKDDLNKIKSRITIDFDSYINKITLKDGESPTWNIKTKFEFMMTFFNDFTPEQQWLFLEYVSVMRHKDSIDTFGKASKCETMQIPNKDNYYSVRMGSNDYGRRSMIVTIFIDKEIIWFLRAKFPS